MKAHLPEFFITRWPPWAKKTIKERNINMEKAKALIPLVSEQARAQGRLVWLVGSKLVESLRGRIQPLELILQDNLLTRCYEEDPAVSRGGVGLGRYVRYLADIKPDLKVLEVGAGTGSATTFVLEALAEKAKDWKYTFTDNSAGFFPNAREKLAKLIGSGAERIEYQKLDVSLDPATQGFQERSFDLVGAAIVLHATSNILTTLQNTAKLLKPNVKLVLLELVDPAASLLPFTLLPGWWNSEDTYRNPEDGPMLTTRKWNAALKEAGFKGVEVGIPVANKEKDMGDDSGLLMSVLCSSKVDDRKEARHGKGTVTICGTTLNDSERDFATAVQGHLGRMPISILCQAGLGR
jgi:ubiquinone/menaquinone biosynthesis C-methylase UbiE